MRYLQRKFSTYAKHIGKKNKTKRILIFSLFCDVERLIAVLGADNFKFLLIISQRNKSPLISSFCITFLYSLRLTKENVDESANNADKL